MLKSKILKAREFALWMYSISKLSTFGMRNLPPKLLTFRLDYLCFFSLAQLQRSNLKLRTLKIEIVVNDSKFLFFGLQLIN